MGIAWRIEYEGALYHILSRCNKQKGIFYDHKDRFLFLETIGKMSERNEIVIFAVATNFSCHGGHEYVAGF